MTLPDATKIKASEGATLYEQANALAEQLPITATSDSRWRAFDKDTGCWVDTSRNLYRPIAQAIVPHAKRTPQRERQLLDLLEGRWQVPNEMFRGALKLESPTHIIVNVPNGTLHVTPDAIRFEPDHDKRLGFTRCLAARYDANATSALFEHVLKSSLPDPEDRLLFQYCVGNFLLPTTQMEAAFVCFGAAGSGKDTCAIPITYALDGGDVEKGIVTHLSLAQICDSNCYALAKLRYACVNICNELDNRAIEESGNFKKLVSGDPIEAREIRQPPFTMTPHCKVWSLTNELPRFKHGTAAEMRRMRFLPFNQVVAKDKIDTTIKERLKVACPGVLNFVLQGLQMCLRLGGKNLPYGGAESRAIHARFDSSNDPMGNFVTNHCDLGPTLFVTKPDLQKAFNNYCEQHGFSVEVQDGFYRKLYDRHPSLDKTSRLGTGDRARIVKGIALKEASKALLEG